MDVVVVRWALGATWCTCLSHETGHSLYFLPLLSLLFSFSSSLTPVLLLQFLVLLFLLLLHPCGRGKPSGLLATPTRLATPSQVPRRTWVSPPGPLPTPLSNSTPSPLSYSPPPSLCFPLLLLSSSFCSSYIFHPHPILISITSSHCGYRSIKHVEGEVEVRKLV